VIEALLSF